ncbi:hypothetical protein [Deminuibacter soli]|uniref:Glycosyltransferase family 1 protein n=1 Tax=Deminuibacter soli TaxID=2291815 RepID=A0A3E1NFW7_9BACT|nr:hypothetical protein [Deminuibacter soli]RFM26688.1 hypothetical protein DXN05_19160 [Deminuibacter soli]
MMNRTGITIYENTRVYVPCPASHATGGTELLHQFVHALRNLGIDAWIYYYRIKDGVDPIHQQFRKYVSEYATDIVDAPENILVVPETRTEYLFKYEHLRKVIWWLSVDFFYDSADVDFVSTWKKRLGITPRFDIKHPEKLKVDLHLVQSQYAADHLEKHGIHNYHYLSDYLNAAFLDQPEIDEQPWNRVLYNPKKGFEFTQTLIRESPELEWFALTNLTPEQVADVCRKSKVYIDFGHHPGKDRFPREAAICGCCIITGRRGAAAFEEDIPIPQQYKFSDADDQVPAIIRQIKHCMDDFETVQHDFDHYRSVIRGQEAAFIQDIKDIFQQQHSPVQQ